MLPGLVFIREGVFSIKVLVEVSRSPNKVLDLVSRCQSSATECVPGPNSTNRGETNDSDHNVSIKSFY